MRKQARSLAMTLALGVLPVVAFAQGAAPEGNEPAAPGAEVSKKRADELRRDAPGLRLGDIDASKVNPEEKKQRAERMLGEQRGSLRRGTELLQEARAANDIIQLNCVNEKLTQIKGLLKLSEDASVDMYDALASGTEDVSNHAYTKIAVAHQKSSQLRAEAEQCVGERSVYTGDTEVEVEIDPSISPFDPTVPVPPPPGPDTPPVASGY